MNQLTWVEISKSALFHNIAAYKKLLGPKSLLAPVIKSNAYGHGIVEVASLLDTHPDVDYLCVVSLSEALMLRTKGITKKIVVLSIIDADLCQAIIFDIEVVVYTQEMVTELNKHAQIMGKKGIIHIKIDTGLSRLGVMYDQALSFIKKCAALPGIEIRGIFSHFAASERSDLTFTYLQKERFDALLKNLSEENIHIPLQHFTCSAAISTLPETHYSFVRMGIGLYGLWSSVETQIRVQQQYPWFTLKPVLTWKTRVIMRKTIPAGSFIGYDCTYQASTATEIATLPIGYFDGYDRLLSNKGIVKIKDQFFPLRGRIAMNLCMADVSTCPEIQEHDEVTLLGNEHLLNADTIAQHCTTINYEIVTRINPLIPRIIVE